MHIAKIDYNDKQAPEKFITSLKESGFAILTNHPLDWQMIQNIYQEWLNFFQSDDKYQYQVKPEQKGGLFTTERSETAKGETEKDQKEFFHIFKSGVYPENISNQAQVYYDQVEQLAYTLLSWLDHHSPQEIQKRYTESLTSMVQGSSHLLRILRYTPLETSESYIRAAAHEDINLITLLPSATASGLQVKDYEGNWLNVPVEPNSLVINIGDMLQEASGGYFPSTTHRVVKHADEQQLERISMPFFMQPRPEVILSERYTAGSYFLERMNELKVIEDGKVLV